MSWLHIQQHFINYNLSLYDSKKIWSKYIIGIVHVVKLNHLF